MSYSSSRLILLTFLGFGVCGPLQAAPSSEGLNAQGQEHFLNAAGSTGLVRFAPAPGAALPELNPLRAFLKEHVMLLTAGEDPGVPSAGPVREIDLAGLLNRQLKTSLTYNLGGKDVWVSGAFDRGTWDPDQQKYVNQNAYVSVLVDGQQAQFFEVMDVLKNPKTMDIGSAKYRLSLSPDMSDNLESEIVLTNAANRKDQQRISLRDMIAAASAAGADLRLSNQAYKVFYYDDLKDGKADPSSRLLVFVLTDAKGEFKVFDVPAEWVPEDQAATFKMYENKPVKLQQVGGKLRISETL